MCCPLHPLTLQEWAVSGPSMWGTCLFEKWNKLLKIPSFLVIWVFSLSGLNAYLVFPVLLIRGQDGFILAHSSVGCHQHDAGAALPASPGSWWCCWLFLLILLSPIPAMATWELLSSDVSSFPLFNLCDFFSYSTDLCICCSTEKFLP